MNTDYLENVRSRLLAMIDEAEKLPAEQIEGIPGTSILVKKGSANDFVSLAHSYFELENNQFADGNYLEEVYQELMNIRNKEENEDLEREEERQISVAYDLYAENHDSITKLGYLNTSLKINLDDQKKYRNALDNKVFDEKEWAERTNLLRTLESLSKSELAIRKDIAVIKDQVNNKVKKVIEQEIERIRDNYRYDKQGLETSYGMRDGVAILAKDKTLYDDLCYLLNALNKVNEKADIICVDNILCVNPNQEVAVKEWINNINVFKLMNKSPKIEQEEKEVKKVNDDLIAEIAKELDRLRSQDLEEATKEYNKLTEILTYLNKANHASYVTPVWGAYVLNNDKYVFEKLVKDCAFFQKYNPDAKKLEENKKIVKELKQRLIELQNNVKNYKGDTNPDIVLVGDTPILESEVIEYHRILAMISMLENSRENLISVVGAGNVSLEYLDKYKELVGVKKEDEVKKEVLEESDVKTTPLNQQKIEINSEVKKGIARELEAILKKALDNPNEPMVVNGDLKVLKSDLTRYNLLVSEYEILSEIYDNDSLIEIEGVSIPDYKAEEYKNIKEQLKDLDKGSIKDVELDFRTNEEFIEGLKEELPKLDPLGEEYKLVLELIDILESAKSSNNIKEVSELNYNGQMIDIYIPVKVPADKISDLANCIGKILDSEKELETNLNEEKIKEIKKQIDELKTVDENNNPLILPHNEEEYDLLNKQFNILNKVVDDKDTVNIEGAIVTREDEKQYRFNLDTLKKIQERKNDIIKTNKDRVDKIKKEIDEMYALDNNIDTEYRKEKYNLLVKQLSVLNSFNLKDEYEKIDGIYVNKSDVNRFKTSVEELNKLSLISTPKQEEEKPQKHRFSSRKPEEKGFLRRNAKKIAGIGIGLYLIPKVLPLFAMVGVTSIGMVGVAGSIAAFYVLYKKYKNKNNLDMLSDEAVRDVIDDVVNEVAESTRNVDLSNDVEQKSKPQIEIPDEDNLFQGLEEALDDDFSFKM